MTKKKKLNILGCTISLILTGISFQVQAQNDSLPTTADTIPLVSDSLGAVGADSLQGDGKSFRLPINSFSFHAEIGKTLVNTALLDGRSFQMFGGDIQIFNRFFVTLDIGRESYEIDNNEHYYYKGTGGFWRLGFDYDILSKDGGYILVGLRYGNAITDFNTSFTLTDDYWGSVQEDIEDFAVSHWAEAHIGLRAELPLGFEAGISGRLTQIIYNFTDYGIKPFCIAGFGNGLYKNTTILEYYIAYRIPVFRDKLPKDE